MKRKVFSIVLVTFFLSLCFYGEAGAVPVTYTAETYMANAYTRVWDMSTTPLWTLLNEDVDNPPNTSTPPVSAHVQIPGIMNQVSYHGTGDALSDAGHLEMSASALSDSADYRVVSYAHAGFVGDFTAATTEVFFGYSMAYDLSVSGDNPFAGFSYQWSLVDITGGVGHLVDNGFGIFSITTGSLSDITTDEILLATTVGREYRLYFDSGPFLDAQITGLGSATASLTADYGLDTESARVPEPSTLLLLGSGLVGLGFVRRRLKR
jgi:hypothetical protein